MLLVRVLQQIRSHAWISFGDSSGSKQTNVDQFRLSKAILLDAWGFHSQMELTGENVQFRWRIRFASWIVRVVQVRDLR